MCGISAVFGQDWSEAQLASMITVQSHRGPDARGIYRSPSGLAGLGHNRLSIIDLSEAGRQPMCDNTGRYWIVFNGEIYNYLELRPQLEDTYAFRTRTDTEVLLAAWLKWGQACLDRLLGMFAFVIWDDVKQQAFGARDRFGVKPLHVHTTASGGLWLASEIKALHAAGVTRTPNPKTWATYLASGMYDHGDATFWKEIQRIPSGGCFTWSHAKGVTVRTWYDVARAPLAAGLDARTDDDVAEELLTLLEHSVRLRFRADVPVGICLSGGLDSSLLLGLVQRIQGGESRVKTFTFFCGDPAYDELPWVKDMLARTAHRACYCRLHAEQVPELAIRVQANQDEPFGGLPTLGMAKVNERAKAEGVTVLLDGNGMDEGWAGYDYYRRATAVDLTQGPVQGSQDRSTRPDCLTPEFAALAETFSTPKPFADPVANLQCRDLRCAKIPRAMRFADRVSMMCSRELREPFLDHRIVELGLRQPVSRKLRNGCGKYLPRRVASGLLPEGVRESPKRALQTPQREWLRGPLQSWAGDCIEAALRSSADNWLNADRVREEWKRFCSGASDNSFYIWQWISTGMILDHE